MMNKLYHAASILVVLVIILIVWRAQKDWSEQKRQRSESEPPEYEFEIVTVPGKIPIDSDYDATHGRYGARADTITIIITDDSTYIEFKQ